MTRVKQETDKSRQLFFDEEFKTLNPRADFFIQYTRTNIKKKKYIFTLLPYILRISVAQGILLSV